MVIPNFEAVEVAEALEEAVEVGELAECVELLKSEAFAVLGAVEAPAAEEL
jgi:hypothetical protein